MNKLIFNILAEKELLESVKWYNEQNKNLGINFYFAVQQLIEKISVSPEVYGYSKKPFREAAVPVLPYLIVYVYNSTKKSIYISSVFHTHRNPGKKFRKIQ
ncbi:MAG: type II toxin-antitoxin system RelE/ParE family toxin [Parafilimonas sp.]